MKHIFSFALLAAFIIASCKSKTSSTDKNTDNAVADSLVNKINILGSYVGAFGDNKINVLITRIAGDSIEGNSIVAGNARTFKGTINKKDSVISISAKEPGDDKNDGSFQFAINASNPNTLTGSWQPYKSTENVGDKKFSLVKRTFSYKADVGEYPQASMKLLSDSDVNNMDKYELEMMRNEIFARHGYCFTRRETRQEFESEDWYIPASVDVRKDITEIERKNITLIKKYEKYAKEYGDDYGR
ncbi:YARHG domain-containing protein [Ferruginibacter albus]|uniref:YARHG domain-containing protein n=1 Tax=Ferruginibacter albus TaxID=2875540 RepID=UPI001CC7D306|nr:YARHG domain-containing protein [Ferruginibacter albus]UAY51792.1 YARHG domain-containing protein [Ferruginibacter albus]